MMAIKVEFRKSALKALDDIPAKDRERLLKRIEELTEDPFPQCSKKLEGSDKLRRVRSGVWRAIYSLPDDDGIIDVIKIAHRGVIYRKP